MAALYFNFYTCITSAVKSATPTFCFTTQTSIFTDLPPYAICEMRFFSQTCGIFQRV